MLGQRIKQSRLAAGLTLDECVARIGEFGFTITKSALSQYENEKRTPGALVLNSLADVLRVPRSWFLEESHGFPVTWYAYRKQARLGKKVRQEIESYAAHHGERVAKVWRLFPRVCNVDFPVRTQIHNVTEADNVAADIRRKWNLGNDALESVTHTLESNGAIILRYRRQETRCFDGLSALINNCWPLLLINDTVAIDRLRFDLAHELGHIVMNTSRLENEKSEEYAVHRFASSFLMPPEVLKGELGAKRSNLFLPELLYIKEKFGISVAALLYAARVHGIVGEQACTALRIELARRGWRRREPDVFRGNENPSRLRQLLVRAVAEDLMSLRNASELFPELSGELRKEFGTSAVNLGNKSKAERNRVLRKAAELTAKEFERNPELVVEDVMDLHED